MNTRQERRIRSVTRGHACAVCSGTHKCGWTDDGLILCGRRSGGQPGFRWLGLCRRNPIWNLYRIDDGRREQRPEMFDARAWSGPMTAESTQALAGALGLPAEVLESLQIGYNATDAHGPCWTFPEKDGKGDIIGIMRRYADGSKRAVRGGQRGLYIPSGWGNHHGPVFLVEGASDTLTLTRFGLSAIGRPSCRGGVAFLAELLRPVEAERPILAVGENDPRETPSGLEWPGRDGARETALRLSERLGRQVLWTLPPDGAKDVRAWAAAHPEEKPEVLVQLLTEPRRPSIEPPLGEPPLSLTAAEPEPAFPVDVLPAAVRDFAAEGAAALGCPPAFLAVPALGAAGAALGNAWELALTATHVQTASLFLLIVGHPGSGKTPALKLVSAPLRRLEHRAIEAHKQAIERWKALPEELRGPPPLLHRLLADDFTTEALGPLLEENLKGVLILKDELAGLINALNQYRGGKGHDRQVLLSLWSGADLVIDRKTQKERGPICVRRPFVGIVGGIQPGVLERLRGNERRPMADDGLLDRFLFAFPPPVPIRGEEWRELSPCCESSWHTILERLVAQQPEGAARTAPQRLLPVSPFAPAPPPAVWNPKRLVLSAEARECWNRFTERLAEQANSEDFPSCLQGAWSKLRAYGARLALVLEALGWAVDGSRPPPVEVSAASVEGAGMLIDWFQAQVRKVHEILETDARRNDALRLLRWLSAHPEIEIFSRRDAYQALRRTFLRPGALDAPLALLLDHRYLTVTRAGDVQRFAVNPLWLPRTV